MKGTAEARSSGPANVRLFVILGTAGALCIFTAILRQHTVAAGWDSFQSPLFLLPRMLARSFYDFSLILVTTIFFVGALHIARPRPGLQNFICSGYVLLALLFLLAAMVNIPVVRIAGQPFDYPLLYYADFLLTPQSHDIAASILTPRLVAIATLTVIGWALTSLLLTFALSFAVGKLASARAFALLGLGAWACYLPFGAWYVATHDENYKLLQNPVVFFLSSVSARDLPPLFSMDTRLRPDVLTVGDRAADDIRAADGQSFKSTLPQAPDAASIENIILYVLESVPAEYVETYGGIFPTTSTIAEYESQSRTFTNIYSPSTNSPKAMISLLCSIYPLISYEMLAIEYPDVALPCLSDELDRRGYRTGYFQSTDLGFQNYDAFLKDRGFDLLQDHRTRRCKRPLIEDAIAPSSDDRCTVRSMIEWIRQARGQPFFAVFWPNGTHFPYHAPGTEIDFGLRTNLRAALDPIADHDRRAFRDEVLNRYLNALHRLDQGLGDLLHALEEDGLAESTLVVVLGDHGQVFGRRGQFAHGHRLYEENVHIPLIFINPALFAGDDDPVLGGLTDVPPTIMDLLGLPLPGVWQGRSLLSGERDRRVYFFTPWSDLLLGYREGDRKFIFNATTNELEVYDLARDPGETTNLADQSPGLRRHVQDRIAAWVQYQSRLMQRLLTPKRDVAETGSGAHAAARSRSGNRAEP